MPKSSLLLTGQEQLGQALHLHRLLILSANATLGFPSNATTGPSFVSLDWINLQPYSEVYLRSDVLGCHGIHGHASEHNILLSIPLTAGFANIIAYDMPNTTWHDTHNITTGILDFQLTDRDGNVLPLQGGDDASISFQLTLDD